MAPFIRTRLFFLKTETLTIVCTLRLDAYGEFAPENDAFKKLWPEWRFFKTLFARLHVNREKQRFGEPTADCETETAPGLNPSSSPQTNG